MISLSQFLLEKLSSYPESKELLMIINDLAGIGKMISKQTNRAGLVNILGAAGHVNIQQEEAQKLDVYANNLCKEVLKDNIYIAALASEEEDNAVDMETAGCKGKYVVAFDPLDGSSNIDVNVSIGTIFSVHKRINELNCEDSAQFLQSGKKQVLAGYILYSSSTMLVFSFGDGVFEFTLDPDTNEFCLSDDKIIMTEKCPYYSVNEGNARFMKEKDQKFVEKLKNEYGCGSRYIGSLVADIHRTLKKGGVFMYPAVDSKGAGEYKGKLRLNYELKPLAFLVEQAGGMAIDGSNNILDIEPSELHQRLPFIAGNKKQVLEYFKEI
jgi:fructose-1,6-bisphosphatase I